MSVEIRSRKVRETRSLRGKVEYVLARKPYLAGDPVGVAQEIWLNFFGHLLEPPVTSPEDISPFGPGRNVRRAVPIDCVSRLPSVKEVEACAAKVSVPGKLHWVND